MMFKIREDYDAYLERCIEEERKRTREDKDDDKYHSWLDADLQIKES